MRSEHVPVTFGEWLKGQRKRLDLTQEELAQRAGCSVFALRKIEAGERRPSKQLAVLLAAALNVPPEEQEIFSLVARGERPLERLLGRAAAVPTPAGSRPESAAAPASLPAPQTRLVGREPELAAIHRIFSQPHCRLITLTGPGGIGKTRLAIQYAACHQQVFPGGVYFVPLASLDSGWQIIPAIAEVVGCAFSGPANLKEQLFAFLKRQAAQPALFVLDNVEHLLEPAEPEDAAAPGLVVEMLQQLPQVKILATSRERLSLHGEWTYELHGLGVPADEMIAEMESYSAIELFIQSARRIDADFYQSPGQQRDILRICRFVDGIPLAIELAAAWVGVLSCAEIAGEIETNIDLLTTTMHDVPRRHRSIRAAFDHSWNLLNDLERDVLQQLAVFRGGFFRDAAEQVAGASLPLLASLVSKSLVRRKENGRYDLHEVIRQYAYSFLRGRPLEEATHDRHCLYYLAALARREKDLKSHRLQEVKRELINDLENIRQAWAWGVEHGYYPALLRANRALGWLYETSGLHQEGIDQFELLIKKIDCSPASPEGSRLRGEALAAQSLLYFRKGEFTHAQARLEKSVAILRPLRDPLAIADPFVYLGVILHLNGDLERSGALLREGRAHAQATGDRWFEAYAIYNLGYIASLRGQYADGYAQMSDGMAIWRELGDPYSIALGLNYLTPTLVRLGKYQLACDGLEESIRLCDASGNRWGAGTAYRLLGMTNMAMENYRLAQSLFQKSLDTFSGFTTGWDIASTTVSLAQSYLLAGRLKEARKTFAEGLALAVQAGVPLPMLDAILGVARVLAEEGRLEPALELACIVRQHPGAYFDMKETAGQLCVRIEKEIPPEQVERIKKRAAGRSPESVLNELAADG